MAKSLLHDTGYWFFLYPLSPRSYTVWSFHYTHPFNTPICVADQAGYFTLFYVSCSLFLNLAYRIIVSSPGPFILLVRIFHPPGDTFEHYNLATWNEFCDYLAFYPWNDCCFTLGASVSVSNSTNIVPQCTAVFLSF